MKKNKTLIILAVLLTLCVIAVSAYFYIRHRNNLQEQERQEKIYNENIERFKPLDLGIDKDIILGCILNHVEKSSVCLNPLSKQFGDLSLYPLYESDLLTYPEGFILLKPTDSGLQQYDRDLDTVLGKWVKYIDENEDDLFFKDIEGQIHVSLTGYAQWGLIRGGSQEKLVEIVKKLGSKEYLNIFPIRDDYREELCNIQEIDCDILDQYSQVPYDYFKDIGLSEFEDIDIFDYENSTKLNMLAMGLQSLGRQSDPTYQERLDKYTELENIFFENYGLDKEEMLFIFNYLPFDLIDYWQVLYEGWNSTEKRDFYSLIDMYCTEDACLKNKLNILYKENEN